MNNPKVAGEMAMIAQLAPAIPILVMSELCDFSEVTRAFRLGARGYLPTSLTISEVTAIVRFVAQGGTYIPANTLDTLFETHRSAPTQISEERKWPCSFSARELQVLELLNEGKPNKVIAYELGMAESTVKVHIRHIMKKLNARNRTQVVLMTQNALRSAPDRTLTFQDTQAPIRFKPDPRALLAAPAPIPGRLPPGNAALPPDSAAHDNIVTRSNGIRSME
jgi:DNA-binding NarL/FixJ family response regulator